MKNKYFISLALIIFIAGASLLGSAVAIFNILPQTFADSSLPHCTNVKKYSRWSNDYATISSPINVTTDEIATYEVPDQSTRCQVVISLNGHTTAEAYYGMYSRRSNLIIGKNAVVTVNGGGGSIIFGEPQSNPNIMEYPVMANFVNAITVEPTSILYLNNVTVDSNGEVVYNSGTAVLTNVVSSAGDDIWNDGGTLTIESGSYNMVNTKSGGVTIINGGTFNGDIRAESGSEAIINGGSINGGTLMSASTLELSTSAMIPILNPSPTDTQDITINGGSFDNVIIESPMIINGGDFEDAIIYSSVTINNGTFTDTDFRSTTIYPNYNAEMTINDGTFAESTFGANITVNDGTFTDSSFGENVTVNDGNFTASTFDDNTTIESGTFDELPANYTVPEDKTVIANDDGTQTVVSTESVITPTEPTDPTNPTDPSEDPTNPSEDNVELCQEIRIYTSKDNYFTVSGILSLSADVRASVVVPDQDEPCKFVINLNGHTLTSADEDLEAIRVGSNVEAEIDGGDGTIVQAPTSSQNPTDETAPVPVIAVESGSTATIKNVTVETSSSDNTSISNEGSTTLSNVTSTNSNIENNGDGELNIESGSYGTISSETGNVTINNDNTTYDEESSNISTNTNPTDPTNPTENPTNPSSGTEETSSTEGVDSATSAGLGSTSIKVPNTGTSAQDFSCGQQVAVGAIITLEAFILAICGYVFRRLNKARRVRF